MIQNLVVWLCLQDLVAWRPNFCFRMILGLRNCWNNSCCNHVKSHRIVSYHIISYHIISYHIRDLWIFKLYSSTYRQDWADATGGQTHWTAGWRFPSQVPITKNQEATIMEEGEFYAIEPCPNTRIRVEGENWKFQVRHVFVRNSGDFCVKWCGSQWGDGGT